MKKNLLKKMIKKTKKKNSSALNLKYKLQNKQMSKKQMTRVKNNKLQAKNKNLSHR